MVILYIFAIVLLELLFRPFPPSPAFPSIVFHSHWTFLYLFLFLLKVYLSFYAFYAVRLSSRSPVVNSICDLHFGPWFRRSPARYTFNGLLYILLFNPIGKAIIFIDLRTVAAPATQKRQKQSEQGTNFWNHSSKYSNKQQTHEYSHFMHSHEIYALKYNIFITIYEHDITLVGEFHRCRRCRLVHMCKYVPLIYVGIDEFGARS